MRYLIWALRLFIFVVALLFALKNTDRVSVYFFANLSIGNVPLIVVMLTCFVVGTVFGILLSVPRVVRHRRAMSALKRELDDAKAQAAAAPFAAEAVYPVSPV